MSQARTKDGRLDVPSGLHVVSSPVASQGFFQACVQAAAGVLPPERFWNVIVKRQFVDMLQDGDVVNDYFVAVRKDLRESQRGSKFLGCVFKDRTGEIGGITWNNAANMAGQFELGQVVNVRGKVHVHKDRLQVLVDQILPLRDEEYEESDLVHIPQDLKRVVDELWAILETMTNPWLKQFCEKLREDEAFVDGFTQAPAGKNWHHAYPGGLAKHCLELAHVAIHVCDVFRHVDRDLVLAGVLMHDVGKIEEMSQGLYIEYTKAGKLVGHVAIGLERAERVIAQIDGFPEDLRLHLQHLILSHNGSLEFGSPVVPKTLEALVLSKLDDLCAQVDAFTRIIEETRASGEEWSPFMPLIQRQIWAGAHPHTD